ncbi:MAG: tRNA uridine-5-carboxymethylaminomethyl(34) synthesis GTPase MnmE [Bacteroidales bacterium]|jgi:tRNA modification GTPase|nr:tRNA uridine-5-carboxymethylaminomethyl(34) synthesis GTPase MnmE [Bacteroidales bacterium]MDI9591992.1 tRNA uridine-5-carboxymethylaminomethyl(34) synthesis GTPase MnmE [Bacteroidota bacterium]HOF80885.1 tRNA uridine-5-carboxymethylaminomethyl(34) synthesis GTPase MnmE [Bacteroidales bacterium]HOR76230.1 tRNA uridine-5-carboxymethylaminomethyl(34) synthesis GTPase MnmE [Bacteroidales bacterium]HPL11637.1 tRNA uridine-5-carboxymethylaminomethyl(34) synthesis GTPase MnmE [Bacteroidales bacter
MDTNKMICALATVPGTAAIAVIRISGSGSIEKISSLFKPAKSNFNLSEANSHTIHYGDIIFDDELLDDVLVSVFRNPHSYTGEDSVEISCHGSPYIQQKLLENLINSGIRLARPGEFTMRAFLNGKMDLAQAEAVADLIASNSKTAHNLAIDQMRGGFSKRIGELRKELIGFASLIELELDFSEENVEFADRQQLLDLIRKIKTEIESLIQSFNFGNVLKAGIPVAIIGKPNVGKSTLLNTLLQEEKAIVSEIPGTTRDSIEDTIIIDGVAFRFIDTAGLRPTEDTIETIGIERTLEKIKQARIILFVFDVATCTMDQIKEVIEEHRHLINDPSKRVILIGNKIDQLIEIPKGFKDLLEMETIFVSAKRKENINLISDSLLKSVSREQIEDNAIVSNTRHYEALSNSLDALNSVEEAMLQGISSDLVASDIRQALYHLGTITGQIVNDDILDHIFKNFCIGK